MTTPPPVHPLPWSIQDGWLTLQSNWRGDEERPYALHAGRNGGVIVSLDAYELRALRDACDDALAAPFRVIVAGSDHLPYGDPVLTGEIRARLDELRTAHPNLEVASESTPGAAGHAAEQWAVEAGMRLHIYPTIAAAIEAGGSRVLLVAGPGSLVIAGLAHQRPIGVQLIRLVNEPVPDGGRNDRRQ